MNAAQLLGLNLLGDPVDTVTPPRVLYVDYARELMTPPAPEKVRKPYRSRQWGLFLPNTGTIVNTAPRLSRNTLVSVDGGPPTKLKHTVLRAHGVPFEVIHNRRQKPDQE